MVNTNGEIPSNYGQYIFDSINQFEYVVNTLKNDKDSRRASIGIMNHFHTLSGDYDLPCTYAINFRIRNDELNMTVHMRSQDAILGLGNDAPTFSFIHEMVYNSLLDTYPDLHYGNYDHFVDSLHIYEKHFPMLIEIVRGRKFTPITIPWINGKDEVDFLIKSDFSVIPPEFKFTQWLCE
jgi:thymidylate synthase